MLYPNFDELIRIGTKRNRLETTSSRPTFEASFGNYASPFRGQGLTFQEVREYRPGDDIRNIDWRVTARSNKPHMKVFSEDRERTVMLCTDVNTAMRFGTRGTFKSVQAARATALLGRLANGSRDRVGCVLFGDVPDGIQFFRPVRSRRGLWQALRVLSSRNASVSQTPFPLETAVRRLDHISPTGSLVFILSDFYPITDCFEQTLAGLRRRCDVVLVRIEDPADKVIAPVGRLRFSNENGLLMSVETDDRAGRDAYALQWKDHRQQLNDICARTGVHVIELHTAQDIYEDILPALRRLQGKRRS